MSAKYAIVCLAALANTFALKMAEPYSADETPKNGNTFHPDRSFKNIAIASRTSAIDHPYIMWGDEIN